MNTLLLFAVVKATNLVVSVWFNRVALVRIFALRQQLGVYKRKMKKPRLRNRDRLFWSLLSKVWGGWESELVLVRPQTVIRWRKRKFREFWRKKSQRGSGRPAIPGERIEFIRRISSDHPEYGEDRIALELEVKFGIRHASSTVRRYMVKRQPPSDSQAWRSFLKNQAKAVWTCDFFVQHTIGCGSFLSFWLARFYRIRRLGAATLTFNYGRGTTIETLTIYCHLVLRS